MKEEEKRISKDRAWNWAVALLMCAVVLALLSWISSTRMIDGEVGVLTACPLHLNIPEWVDVHRTNTKYLPELELMIIGERNVTHTKNIIIAIPSFISFSVQDHQFFFFL